MSQRPTPETDAATVTTGYLTGEPVIPAHFARNLARERDEAREELEDWRNAAKGVENPHPDEKHCTCVPLLHKQLKDAREAFAIATDQLVQAQMDNRRLSETLARLQEWHSLTNAGLRLRCGEMTAQEIRTVRAVLNNIKGE